MKIWIANFSELSNFWVFQVFAKLSKFSGIWEFPKSSPTFPRNSFCPHTLLLITIVIVDKQQLPQLTAALDYRKILTPLFVDCDLPQLTEEGGPRTNSNAIPHSHHVMTSFCSQIAENSLIATTINEKFKQTQFRCSYFSPKLIDKPKLVF